MSAVGRLWRRAPAWRLSAAAAVAFTALAAMFPPPLPRWLPRHATPTMTAPTADRDAGPRYVPQTQAAAAPDYGIAVFPPADAGRTGIIPFAGRQLPLPAGSWQELVLARSAGAAADQASLLGRIEHGRLTGLLLAASPGPVSGGGLPAGGFSPCFAPDAIAHQIIPTTSAQGPMARECWTLTAFDAAQSRPDEMMRGGFERLDRMAVAVPDHMLAMRYLRTDDTGWLTVLLLLPDRSAQPPGDSRRLQAWIRRFVPILHKGFDGTLTAGELTPAIARDPEE